MRINLKPSKLGGGVQKGICNTLNVFCLFCFMEPEGMISVLEKEDDWITSSLNAWPNCLTGSLLGLANLRFSEIRYQLEMPGCRMENAAFV